MDTTEVFCPGDSCAGSYFPPFPIGIAGSVSGFLFGTAVVCGGAQTTYKGCTEKNSAQYCSRNAECVQTAGGSLWCTGPKTNACYIYDRYLTKDWKLSPKSLVTARAYAASVSLPSGRMWILGGADQTSILKTTEFVDISNNAISRVSSGPDMEEPLLGHCAALVTSSQAVVLGGFSSMLNDHTPQVRVYDFNTQTWDKKSWMSAGPRIDSSCLNVEINGLRQVLLTGGWNNQLLADTAVFSTTEYRWLFFNESNPNPIRSSVLIERNQKPYLLGGVVCSSEGKSCKQTSKGKKVHSTSQM